MRRWLDDAAQRLAEAGGRPVDDFALDETEIASLLDLAGVAAHESGDRTNAPLVTFLVGLACAGDRVRFGELVRAAASGEAAAA